MSMDNIIKGLDDAEIPGRGEKFPKGMFVVQIEKIKLQESQQLNNVVFFVVELLVVSSDHPEVKPGSKRSWTVNMTHKLSLGNMKGFYVAALGLPVEEAERSYWNNNAPVKWSEVDTWARSEANPLMGRQLRLETREIVTKQNQQEFMVHQWSPGQERYPTLKASS